MFVCGHLRHNAQSIIGHINLDIFDPLMPLCYDMVLIRRCICWGPASEYIFNYGMSPHLVLRSLPELQLACRDLLCWSVNECYTSVHISVCSIELTSFTWFRSC